MELTTGADVDYISATNVEFITCIMQIWKEYYLYLHDIYMYIGVCVCGSVLVRGFDFRETGRESGCPPHQRLWHF